MLEIQCFGVGPNIQGPGRGYLGTERKERWFCHHRAGKRTEERLSSSPVG